MEKPYIARDYAGFDAGKFKFYFGYEELKCSNHKPNEDGDCENCEWAFVVRHAERGELMRLAQSELSRHDGREMSEYLLTGVQKFVAEHVTQ